MSTLRDTAKLTPPPRAQWPEAARQTEAGRTLTELIVTTFRLNAVLLDAAQRLAAEGGLTAARWQVLGGVLDEPRTVAEIGRRMGLARQSIQRVADVLVGQGLAEYRPNPGHRRAKLLARTEAGLWAIRRIAVVQHPWSDRIAAAVGHDELHTALGSIQSLVEILEADERDGNES